MKKSVLIIIHIKAKNNYCIVVKHVITSARMHYISTNTCTHTLRNYLLLTASTNGSYASSTRYASVVPESIMVPPSSDVAKTDESISNFFPSTDMLCKFIL